MYNLFLEKSGHNLCNKGYSTLVPPPSWFVERTPILVINIAMESGRLNLVIMA
jgi:hypothetical protein